jgi:parvulin-like peptidyl-prolyl isomerase
LKQPLFHFLVAGSILFVSLSWFAIDRESEWPTDSGPILVEREALLDFIRSRTKAAADASMEIAFDALEPKLRQSWVDRYVREEVLVREARALGLDRHDELIRRRLAQKIEFLTLGLLEEEVQIDESELETLYRERGEDYRLPTTLTFTHVFIRQAPDARERAESLVILLNEEQALFRDALARGDRFLYNRNYVDRSVGEVRSHFGKAFSERLEAATPDETRWVGPFASDHGWHAVLFARRTESRLPPLSEIAALLRDEGRREKREKALDKAIDALIAKYPVEVRLGAD